MNRLTPLLLLPLVALLLLWPHAAPRPSSQLGAGTTGFEATTGAPYPTVAEESWPHGGSNPPATGVSGAPRPSQGTDLGYYCSSPCKPTPRPVLAVRSRDIVTGTATYYCRPLVSRCTVGYPQGMYAAAGPEVRAMLGPDWRGQTVNVVGANGVGRLVVLIDWCWCPIGSGHVLDLYWDAFRGLVNPVTVTP